MDTPSATANYKHHRFPVEILSHAVWLYFRCCLSFRDVEELLSERGIKVTYEAIRKWCASVANTMPTSSAAAVLGPGTSGISMR